MPQSIRRATLADLPEVANLLLRDAQQRSSLEPALWRLAPDARGRIEGGVRAGLKGSNTSTQELWHVAEAARRIVGVATVLAVCPAAWTSKIAVLERDGYRCAKRWMLKR